MNNESNYGEDITQQTAQDIQFKALTDDERKALEEQQPEDTDCLSCGA